MGFENDDILVSRASDLVMSGDENGRIKIWDWVNLKILYQGNLDVPEKISALDFSGDFGSVLVGCLNQKVLLFQK